MSKESTYNRSDFEIMAPAGSWESLAAAFQAGADSVYFGIESLNMRSRSSNNFSIDDLKEIARQCLEKGVKSYLTINTVLYDGDLSLMQQIVDAAKEAEISAVIAADVSVMGYARQKEVEIHLSTQLNIANIEALKFYAHFADVVVLARELNLDQVAEIYDQIVAQNIRGPTVDSSVLKCFVMAPCVWPFPVNVISASRNTTPRQIAELAFRYVVAVIR